MPEKKDYVTVSKRVHKSLCNLQELYTAFKENHPNVNIGFSNFCALRPIWCVLAGSKITHSVYVCGAYQNVVLLVDAMDWNLTYKDLIKLTLSCLKGCVRYIFASLSCLSKREYLRNMEKCFLFHFESSSRS